MTHSDEDLFYLKDSFNCIFLGTNKYYFTEDSKSIFPLTFGKKIDYEKDSNNLNLNQRTDNDINLVDSIPINNFGYKENESIFDSYKNESLHGNEYYYDENIKEFFDKSFSDSYEVNTADITGKKKSIENKYKEIKEENIKIDPKKKELQKEATKGKEKREGDNKIKLPPPPYHYLFDEIKNKFFQKLNKDTYDKVIDSFIYTDHLKDLEKKMNDDTYYAPKRRNRDKEKKVIETKKLGRKRKDDNSNGEHNKDSEDNIIKKIKAKVICSLLEFINELINSSFDEEKIKSYVKIMKNIKGDKEPQKEDLIKDLNYKKTVDGTKREINLKFFDLKLKDFLSIEISPKFSTYPNLSNKIIINEIIKNEEDNKILMFVLNDLTFGDYIDIYTHKKELNSFKKLGKDELLFIQCRFIYVDELLEEIHKINNENNYFSRFVSILYNLKRWFFIKQERVKKKIE